MPCIKQPWPWSRCAVRPLPPPPSPVHSSVSTPPQPCSHLSSLHLHLIPQSALLYLKPFSLSSLSACLHFLLLVPQLKVPHVFLVFLLQFVIFFLLPPTLRVPVCLLVISSPCKPDFFPIFILKNTLIPSACLVCLCLLPACAAVTPVTRLEETF